MNGLDVWGLSRAPFESSPEPDFFFPSDDHREALARLEFLSREPGTQLGLLTGEIGCGKSLVRGVFARQSAPRRLVAQVTSSHYSFVSILRSLLAQLGAGEMGPGAVEYDLMTRLQELMRSRKAPVVVLLDEAQELQHDALVGLRAMTNLVDGHLDLKIILVGQPELRDLVLSLPQLDQRAGLRFHLRPLAGSEVGPYLKWRLTAAGHSDGELFVPEAVSAMATVSRGVPREINRVSRLAMAVAAGRGAERVEERDVDVVVSDLVRQRGTVIG
jgi:general secretion pathway protein A